MFPRRFALIRHVDYTGVSGIGVVAYGVVFADGQVALRWCSAHPATSLWNSVGDMLAVHGHGDGTSVQWIDNPYDALTETDDSAGTPGRRARRSRDEPPRPTPTTPPTPPAAEPPVTDTTEPSAAPPVETAEAAAPPVETAEAAVPAEPAEAAVPAEPAETAEAAVPTEPAETAEAAVPTEPVPPAEPPEPTVPAAPAPAPTPVSTATPVSSRGRRMADPAAISTLDVTDLDGAGLTEHDGAGRADPGETRRVEIRTFEVAALDVTESPRDADAVIPAHYRPGRHRRTPPAGQSSRGPDRE